MTRANMLEEWGEYLAHGRRRSPHTVRAYVATAARLLDELGETDWPALARLDAPALRNQLALRRADGPGQFAFADPVRVRRVLAAAGWQEIGIVPVDVACTFAAADLPAYLARMGPLARRLDTLADDVLRARVEAVVEAAFAPFVQGDVVRFDAACWRIDARAP